jgi:hypothetical protein
MIRQYVYAGTTTKIISHHCSCAGTWMSNNGGLETRLRIEFQVNMYIPTPGMTSKEGVRDSLPSPQQRVNTDTHRLHLRLGTTGT